MYKIDVGKKGGLYAHEAHEAIFFFCFVNTWDRHRFVHIYYATCVCLCVCMCVFVCVCLCTVLWAHTCPFSHSAPESPFNERLPAASSRAPPGKITRDAFLRRSSWAATNRGKISGECVSLQSMNLQIATGALQMMKSAMICSIEKYGKVPPAKSNSHKSVPRHTMCTT